MKVFSSYTVRSITYLENTRRKLIIRRFLAYKLWFVGVVHLLRKLYADIKYLFIYQQTEFLNCETVCMLGYLYTVNRNF